MNAIVNKLLLAGGKFMLEMHLRQPGFTDSACEHSLKIKKIKKFKETVDSWYIYENKLDKACSQHDMAYADLKDLNRKTAADKVFHVKAFNNAKNRTCLNGW